MVPVGPQASELGDDTGAWYVDSLQGNNWSFRDNNGGATAPPGVYSNDMQPMRFKISGGQIGRYESPGTTPYTDKTIPASSHAQPFICSSTDLSIPFGFTGFTNFVCQIYAYRILLDATDVTGVVEITPLTLALFSDANLFTRTTSAGTVHHGFTTAIPIPSAVTLEFDLWLRMTNTVTSSTTYEQYATAFATTGYGLNAAFSQSDTWFVTAVTGEGRATADHKYRVTFGGDGLATPGGVNPITLAPTTGWTFLKETGRHRLTKNSDGTFVEVDWRDELVYVTAKWTNGSSTQNKRYLAADSGDYPDAPGGIKTGGVWNQAGTTVFSTGQYLSAGTPEQWVDDAPVSPPFAAAPLATSVTVDVVGTH